MDQQPSTIRASIPASAVVRLAPFIAFQDIRYYLNGLHIRTAAPRPGVYVEATDGSTAGVIYEAGGDLQGAADVIVHLDRATIAACRRVMHKAGSAARNLVIQGNRCSVAAGYDMAETELETHIQPGKCRIEANYPDLVRVMPDLAKLKAGAPASLAVGYLARLGDVTGTLNKRQAFTSMGVQLWQEDGNPTGAVVVQFHGIPTMIAIIMPRRSDTDGLKPVRGNLEQGYTNTKAA